jgi:hypothetical protein
VFAIPEGTDALRRANIWWRSYLLRISDEDFGYFRKKLSGITATRRVKCNGATIQKKMLPRKKKTNWKQSFHKSFSIYRNLKGEIHPKGGRFVTP